MPSSKLARFFQACYHFHPKSSNRGILLNFSKFYLLNMRKYTLIPLFLLCLLPFAHTQTIAQPKMDSLDQRRIEYIGRFKNLAILEMYKSGIPASITLAQGLLETSAGASLLAQQANNHFGMKCGNRWSGATFYKADDEYVNGQLVKSCFRSYADPADNFSDHSDFLRDPNKYNRYGNLFFLDPLDYVAWATGLQTAGYSPVGHYSARLIEYIERYRLHEIDYQAWENRRQVSARQRVVTVNGVRMVRAVEGETLAEIAYSCSRDISEVMAWNEGYYNANTPLTHGTPVFIDPKLREWAASEHEFFFVHEGMRIFEISQLFGIQMKNLRDLNGLADKDQPAMKSKVRISGKRMSGEKMATTSTKIKNRVPALPQNRKPHLMPIKSEYLLSPANQYALNQILDTPYSWHRQAIAAPEVAAAPVQFGSGENEKKLLAPQKKAVSSPSENESAALKYHEVGKGDTLMAVSRKYGVSIADLRKMNNLTQDTIKIGQRLRVK